MNRIKGLKIYIAVSLLLMLGLILGPNLKWFNPARWWGESLIVLMNENEARPCGGFVTAYGVLGLPFGGVELNNSFAFPEVDLGAAKAPLDRVANNQNFWDLGTSINLNQCGQEFLSAYERATGNYPDRVFLIHSDVVENYLKALGSIKAGEAVLNGDNFFAYTSRLVADIDRHDEGALAERKNPLHLFGKRLITSTILRPWRWHAISQSLHQAEQNGSLHLHTAGKEKIELWQKNPERAVTLSEWNLGGGKSSRYLDKQWTALLTQTNEDTWQLENQLTVTHLGGQDQPLSQTWQGGFEITAFGRERRFVPATINPGETFNHTEVFTISNRDLFTAWKSIGTDLATLNLYAPPYQNWNMRLGVSAMAQQQINAITKNLTVQESTARWSGQNDLSGEAFSFTLVPDSLAPFLTWHKPLSNPSAAVSEALALAPGDIVVELHFNEPIQILNARPATLENGWRRYLASDLNITLQDRNYAVPDVIENLTVQTGLLLSDRTTLLLKIQPETYQINERYFLEIEGVADRWSNRQKIENRTVITR